GEHDRFAVDCAGEAGAHVALFFGGKEERVARLSLDVSGQGVDAAGVRQERRPDPDALPLGGAVALNVKARLTLPGLTIVASEPRGPSPARRRDKAAGVQLNRRLIVGHEVFP